MASPPSGTNTFVPDHKATGNLIIGFSRNAKDFSVNNYVEIIPVKKRVGLYASYTSQQQVRIMTANDAEHVWADGEAAPVGFDNMDSFVFLPYTTTRRAYAFTIGDEASEQAEWNIIALESEGRATQAMTARTMLVQAALSGASYGSNTAAVANGLLPASTYWDTGGTPTQAAPWQKQYIYKCLQYGCKQINLVTSGVVKPKQLSLVINPTCAQRISSSNEMLEYIKQSPFAKEAMLGTAEWTNKDWDVPDKFHKIPITVEDAVRISSLKDAASLTQSYVMADNVAYLIAFPGKLQGVAGHRSFSTVQVFFYKDELTVESFYDANNRRTTSRVVSDYDPKVVTTLSSFKFTDLLDPGVSLGDDDFMPFDPISNPYDPEVGRGSRISEEDDD